MRDDHVLVLRAVHDRQWATLNQVAEQLHMNRASVGRVADALVKDGYLHRLDPAVWDPDRGQPCRLFSTTQAGYSKVRKLTALASP
jgi:predicted ArsR family transcriptional regulator